MFCRECGKQVMDGAPHCPSCGTPDNYEPKPSPKSGSSKRKKHIILTVIVILMLLMSTGYYGVQWYYEKEEAKKTQDYIEKIVPLYRSCEIHEQDLAESIYKSDGISEARRVGVAAKELRNRLVEINPPNKACEEIKALLLKQFSLQIEQSEHTVLFRQYENREIIKTNYVNTLKSIGPVSSAWTGYKKDSIDQGEWDARESRESKERESGWLTTTTSQYLVAKKAVISALGTANPQGKGL